MAVEDAYELAYREAVRALDNQRTEATACFALLSLCTLAIVWPHADRYFDIDPQALLAAHLSGRTPDATALSAELIGLIAFHHRANVRRLARMSRNVHIGACLLAIQLVLTVLAAAVTV